MLFMVTGMTVMKKFAIYFLRRGICDDMYWKKSITVQMYTISEMLEIMTCVFLNVKNGMPKNQEMYNTIILNSYCSIVDRGS